MTTYRIGGNGTHCRDCAIEYMDANGLDIDDAEDREEQMVDVETDGDVNCAECGKVI